jgi:antitoxin MazE6
MKTAISIDDGLPREVGETARSMGLRRSRLFALAVGDFLERRRREQMLHRLNEVYSRGVDPAEITLLNGSRQRSAGLSRNAGERDPAGTGVLNVSQILAIDKLELVECTGTLGGTAAGAVCDGLHMLFDRL